MTTRERDGARHPPEGVVGPGAKVAELRALLAPLLEEHGYPSDAAERMTVALAAAADVVPELLQACQRIRRADDAGVVACLLAAATLAERRFTTQRLHVALTLMESIAGLLAADST